MGRDTPHRPAESPTWDFFVSATALENKVREISRVATPETEREWLLYAKTHNMREIERAVARKKEGDPPPKDGDLGGLQTFLNLLYRVTPKTKLAWETAFAKVSSEFPRGTSNDQILTYIAELLLRTPRDPEREGKHPPIYTIVFQMGPDGRGWAEFPSFLPHSGRRDTTRVSPSRLFAAPTGAGGGWRSRPGTSTRSRGRRA